MKRQYVFLILVFVCGFVFAENIDPYEEDARYGWSENTGWLSLKYDYLFPRGATGGVQVYSDHLEGYIWGENIGWINLWPKSAGTVNEGFHVGVLNNNGILSGLAWGENVGWINFDPSYPGEGIRPNPIVRVVIYADGSFGGMGWGENIGWIKFDSEQSWDAKVCVVNFDDLQNFADDWLQIGDFAADLDADSSVDMQDYSILASYWQDYCPNGWEMK